MSPPFLTLTKTQATLHLAVQSPCATSEDSIDDNSDDEGGATMEFVSEDDSDKIEP